MNQSADAVSARYLAVKLRAQVLPRYIDSVQVWRYFTSSSILMTWYTYKGIAAAIKRPSEDRSASPTGLAGNRRMFGPVGHTTGLIWVCPASKEGSTPVLPGSPIVDHTENITTSAHPFYPLKTLPRRISRFQTQCPPEQNESCSPPSGVIGRNSKDSSECQLSRYVRFKRVVWISSISGVGGS